MFTFTNVFIRQVLDILAKQNRQKLLVAECTKSQNQQTHLMLVNNKPCYANPKSLSFKRGPVEKFSQNKKKHLLALAGKLVF